MGLRVSQIQADCTLRSTSYVLRAMSDVPSHFAGVLKPRNNLFLHLWR